MITLLSACVLIGCLSDVPVIVSNDPVRSYLVRPRKQKVDKSQYSCYIEGVFHTTCPRP